MGSIPRSAAPAAVRPGALAGALGMGMVAGVAGTAAMTVSSAVESRARGRTPSTTPARAASLVLGVAPVDERGERRFNVLVHWGYGAAWGTVHGALAALGVGPAARTLLHGAVVWGGAQLVLPATGAAPPASEWPREEVAVDLWHHAVYAAATSAAYRWLSRR